MAKILIATVAATAGRNPEDSSGNPASDEMIHSTQDAIRKEKPARKYGDTFDSSTFTPVLYAAWETAPVTAKSDQIMDDRRDTLKNIPGLHPGRVTGIYPRHTIFRTSS